MNNYEYKGKVINVGHTCSYDTVMQALLNILNEHDDLAPYIRQHKELNEAIDLIKEGDYNLARCKWMEYCDYRGITKITKNKSNEHWHCNGLLDNPIHGALSVFQYWSTTEYLGCSNKDTCPKVKDGSCKSTTRKVKSVFIPVPKDCMNNIQELLLQRPI